MKYLVVLVFAMAAIAIGEKLWCLQCKAVGEEDCTGESVMCENEDDICMKGVEHSTLNGDLKIAVNRGCTNISKMCDKTITFTSTKYKVITYHKCCYKNNCNSGIIKMPKQNTAENGFICPACLTVGNDTCDEKTEQLPCINNQQICYVYTGSGSRPGEEDNNYYVSGCLTKDTCDYALASLVGSMPGNSSSMTCSRAKKRAPKRHYYN
uniref:Sodefrin-like factor C n=1 Tax=Boana cinerascens TaxID=2364978 RepID=A0A513ZV72_9NEOB|nr:sodefrin precursor-like factor C [Boana cinerascens]